MKAVFIYFLKDPENPNKGYVGVTENPIRRYREHKCSKEICYRGHWIRSLKKRGLAPELEVLAQIPELDGPQNEIYYIAALTSMGFDLVNGTPGGEGAGRGEKHPRFGKKHTPETCARISAAKKGKASNNKGIKSSPEAREKNRRSHIGLKHTPEACAKISKATAGEKNPFFGKKHSPAAIAKQTLAKQGEKHPNFGKKFSPEHCANISAGKRLAYARKKEVEANADAR